MQHPVTNEYKNSRTHVETTLEAIRQYTDLPVLWFWPNVDAGSDGTSTGIRSFRERYDLDHVHFFKNMKGDDFLNLLDNSKGLIGNSSVGIRECSYLGVPVINIGSRQNRRQRGANVTDVNYNTQEILDAMQQIETNPRPKSVYIYGEGDAGKKIAEVLAKVELKFHKTISY
jgi:UDP-N-acetylglucosamine 2-epimerase